MSSSTDGVAITTANVMKVDPDSLRTGLFGMIETHGGLVNLDPPRYVRLLGEYAALYQYMSELYVYLVDRVRVYSQAGNAMGKLDAMNRRDCLEQILKAVKMQYDSLSRKITTLTMEDAE